MKWFIQRGRRGWAVSDSWDAHYHIAVVISGVLNRLAEDGMGYPSFLDYDSKGNKKEINTHYSQKSRKKWERILKKIAKGFDDWRKWEDEGRYAKENNYDEEGNYDIKKVKKLEKKVQKSLKESCALLAEHFNGLWD